MEIRSEVLRLTWLQVDLEAGTVRLEVGTTKNKDGRLIYLTEELRCSREPMVGTPDAVP